MLNITVRSAHRLLLLWIDITDRYPLEQAAEAYANYEQPTSTIATIIEY